MMIKNFIKIFIIIFLLASCSVNVSKVDKSKIVKSVEAQLIEKKYQIWKNKQKKKIENLYGNNATFIKCSKRLSSPIKKNVYFALPINNDDEIHTGWDPIEYEFKEWHSLHVDSNMKFYVFYEKKGYLKPGLFLNKAIKIDRENGAMFQLNLKEKSEKRINKCVGVNYSELPKSDINLKF